MLGYANRGWFFRSSVGLILGSLCNMPIVFAKTEPSAILIPQNQSAVYRAIIFDCDGVLVDTEHTKFLAWKEALARYGVSFELDEYKAVLGNSLKRSTAIIMAAKRINLPAEKVIAEKNKIYKKLHLKDKPKAILPAVSLVRQLVENKQTLNIKLGLASS